MRSLVTVATDVLTQMHDPSTGLFSSTTRVIDGEYVSSFAGTQAVRYSVNSLLGIARATAHAGADWDLAGALDLFLERNGEAVVNAGDRGLLLWLLAETDHRLAEEWAKRVTVAASDVVSGPRALPLQDVCWLLSGLSIWARSADDVSAGEAARVLHRHVLEHYWDEQSRFPLHVPRGWRSSLVSFGGVTYAARALWDYYRMSGDETSATLFADLTRRAIAQQCELGEWPWLYHVRSGRAVERYDVFSVHQEAMAMLFLLPAASLDVEGSDEAIRRSYRWILGENELGVPMWRTDPFLVYRGVRRRMRLPAGVADRSRGIGRRAERLSNLIHATAGTVRGRQAPPARPGSLEVNQECRSYEMGWTAFVWAGVTGHEEFTDVDSWPGGIGHQ